MQRMVGELSEQFAESAKLEGAIKRNLATLFNQAVRRNADRFPEDFMFQLFTEELPVVVPKAHPYVSPGWSRASAASPAQPWVGSYIKCE